tara:strand:- start:7 stop:735 length:729 start_codon:yes stop_codon:yes gene_type:complete
MLSEVNSNSGFGIYKLSKQDLKIFQSLVLEQYLEIVSSENSNLDKDFDISEYHNTKIANTDLHKKLWPKKNRILNKIRFKQLMKSKFFSELRSKFDWYEITNEENVGEFGEVYFRLCRPLPHKDIGEFHADAWFWELGHGEMPKVDFNTQRIKFWFCLETKESKTGFRFVPGSHKNNYNYQGEHRDGFVKPTFNEAEHDLLIESLRGKPGTFIVFNDRLLHSGELLDIGTRVSIEFTLVVRN